MTPTHRQPDYLFITLFGGLLLFGLIVLMSASAPLAYQKFGNPYRVISHQFITGVLPGLILFFIASRFPYAKLKKLAWPMLIGSVVLLLLVFIPGLRSEYGTARSWVNLGGFSLQPSELVKITFLIYLAAWLDGRGQRQVEDWQAGFLPFVSVLGVISVLMLLQPDLGTLMVIVSAAVITYFVGGGSLIHLAGLGLAGVLGIGGLVAVAPYRLNRFLAFLHPERDPQGIAYHVWQALIAIGSGGILGVGFGHSRQKFSYLPEVTGDSIFAIMAEEIGFVFTTIFIAVFVWFLYRGIRLSEQAPDRFSRLLIVGFLAWLAIQFFTNIAAMLSLMPITGIPLPFISAGGSALVAACVAVGIITNISRSATH